MSRIPLQTNGNLIRCGPIRLRTPGLAGKAVRRDSAPAVTRNASLFRPVIADALQRNAIHVQDVVELDETREVTAFQGPVPRTRHNEPAIELQAPAPPAGWGQFIVTTDESGVVTWEFSDIPFLHADERMRGPDEVCTYRIRRAVAPSETTETIKLRGWVAGAGKKLIEVLVFPLLDPVLGDLGSAATGVWEEKFRTYDLRSWTPENYQIPNQTRAPLDWERFKAKKSLLLIHGTFSRTDMAFRDLPAACATELYQRYQGRIFAFDHFTLIHDPRQNVDWLLNQLPMSTDLELDILCHSRGGLVARTLSEKASEFSLGSRTLKVDRMIHVGAPNLGTPLTDTVHLDDLIESYANLLSLLPDSTATLILDGLLFLAKRFAAKSMDSLDGLYSMMPSGPFLNQWLNSGTASARYFAIASSYRPTHRGMLSWATDRLFRNVFNNAANDLVVPTASVYDRNGSSLFPISPENRLVFEPEDGVTHTSYFAHPRTQESILRWLT